ncbi:MAG: transposase [Oceanipulchritudo sp.]
MDNTEIPFFNPYLATKESRNRLPHWEQAGSTYFITFHLGDSLPTKVLNRWRKDRAHWLKEHPKPWDSKTEMTYYHLFARRIDRWLDAGYGECLLADPRRSRTLQNVLMFFDGNRCRILSTVIMPNHVHLLFVQNPDWPLEVMLHSWKRVSAREINRQSNRSGSLWQKDYFDRLVRDEGHFLNCVEYIRLNPVRAGLQAGTYRLYESPLVRQL